MSGYCPTGKCKCENKITLLYRSGILVDACKINQRLTEGSLKLYDVCPWPLHRVRANKTLPPINDVGKFRKGHAAGRLSGLREAREAVEGIIGTGWADDRYGRGYQNGVIASLAAIDKLMEGK